MSIGKARHAWGRVLFVRLDGCEIVVKGGRLGEDLGETCASSFNVGYVRDGYPDEIGEMIRYHKVRDMRSKSGS